jgi:rod shape-determining protein MreC
VTARTHNWIVIILFFLVISIIFLPDTISSKIKLPIIYLSQFPLYVSDVSSKDMIGMLQYKRLLKENKDLKDKLTKINYEIKTSDELRLENQRLKELMDYKKSLSFETVACHVIGRDPSNWRNTLLLNKGTRAGIKDAMGVIYFGGLAGKVVSAYAGYSRVMLITDPASRVAVKVQRTRDEAILEGFYDGLCRLKYLPLDSMIIMGDRVITSANSSIYPEGIYVGKVVSIDFDPSYTYKTAIVKPEYNLINLEDVLCLKEKQ